jgi:hypothetical protein
VANSDPDVHSVSELPFHETWPNQDSPQIIIIVVIIIIITIIIIIIIGFYHRVP